MYAAYSLLTVSYIFTNLLGIHMELEVSENYNKAANRTPESR
jgi:hypothetical protein